MSGKATGIGNVAIQIDGRRRALEKKGAKVGGEGGEEKEGSLRLAYQKSCLRSYAVVGPFHRSDQQSL
jgi:hypothetical protein